jgi:hypothetical protein
LNCLLISLQISKDFLLEVQISGLKIFFLET